MHLGRFVIIVFAACLASGCVQNQISSLRTQCSFENDPRFAILKGKVPLSPSEVETPPTLAQVSNRTYPTPQENKALLALDNAWQPCVKGALEIFQQHGGPAVVAIATKMRNANVRELKRLSDRQITFGDYRQNTYDIYVAAQSELAREVGQIAAIQAQQQANVAASLAAANSALQAARPSQVVPVYRPAPPVTTNCRRIGQTIHCQSF